MADPDPAPHALPEDAGTSIRKCLRLLRDWAAAAERHWYPLPGRPDLGCYGTGYDNWGVQANQKALGALAVLAKTRCEEVRVPDEVRALALERALAALRFSLHSHRSGQGACTDGTPWGHTWISALGLERMLHAVPLLTPHLSESDRAGLRRVLWGEADWLLRHYRKGGSEGVTGALWNRGGRNVPESNLWNGALLWRVAAMYPDHPDVDAWRERAHRFLMNAVSVPADAADERPVEGRPVRDWHSGPNFFPNYALDHHGYLNVGYMVICLSNAAMLHYDLQALGHRAPGSLYHHLDDLWRVVRRFVFQNGRLARIGGDTRVRYAYCQDYLLPALVFAADHLGDRHALGLLSGQLGLIEEEAALNGDGTFYGKRLADMARESPYYYTRLESDRACALGMAATYLAAALRGRDAAEPAAPAARAAAFERSVEGAWSEPEHGAALHRGPSRLASFAWRAHGLAQGLCLPPDQGHLAEWEHNLAGLVRFQGDGGQFFPPRSRPPRRELLTCRVETFPGGFATSGALAEGLDLTIAEGWRGTDSAVHRLAFAALPDGHTVVGLQICRAAGRRVYTSEIKGLLFNLPNDLYNAFERTLVTPAGRTALASPAAREEVLGLGGCWAHVEGRVGIVGLYGADQLVVSRSPSRRGGAYGSLFVEEICFPCVLGATAFDAGATILDAGWAVLSDCDLEDLRAFEAASARREDLPDSVFRAVEVAGMDGRRYWVGAHFGAEPAAYPAGRLFEPGARMRDLVSGEEFGADPRERVPFPAGGVRVAVREAGGSSAIDGPRSAVRG